MKNNLSCKIKIILDKQGKKTLIKVVTAGKKLSFSETRGNIFKR